MNFKTFYVFSFYLILLLTFLLGGFLQFFLGVSNTLLTFFISGLMIVNYLFYALIKNKIIKNKIILIALIYIILIIISSIINNSNSFSEYIYLIFPVLPLGVYLFCFINSKEKYLSKRYIFKILFFIAIIQLPIILLQYYFYDALIIFNRSGQKIASFDFLFGSFFLKSDHSLGFFLLLIILSLISNYHNVRKTVLMPYLSIIYLSFTILLAQSNVSKLILILLLMTLLSFKVYKKYKNKYLFKTSVVILISVISIIGYSIRDSEVINKRLGGNYEKQLSVNKSFSDYNKGTAKRSQIIVVAMNKLKFKWIGDGPYSYFNILTGKFKKSIHFSQLIWTYFDLGIIGLLTVLIYIYSLFKKLEIEKGLSFIVFFSVFVFYSMYATTFSDIAMMTSVFFIFHKSK